MADKFTAWCDASFPPGKPPYQPSLLHRSDEGSRNLVHRQCFHATGNDSSQDSWVGTHGCHGIFGLVPTKDGITTHQMWEGDPVGWEEGKASIADRGKIRIVGGNLGLDFNALNCMVKAMEGEGCSDWLSDMLWSGLGIRWQARKLRLWFIRWEERCSPKKKNFLFRTQAFVWESNPDITRVNLQPKAGAYTANALTSGLNIYLFADVVLRYLRVSNSSLFYFKGAGHWSTKAYDNTRKRGGSIIQE